MADLKKIILHPTNPDGSRDDSISYYPKTDASIVHYDTIEKEIPGEIVDGETYTLPKEYDNEWVSSIILTAPDNTLFVYGTPDESDKDGIFFSVMGLAVFLNSDTENKAVYDYVPEANPLIQIDEPGWYSVDTSQEGQPVFTPYTGNINITIDSASIVEGQEEILKKVLGLEPTIIQVERSLVDKVNDLKNWEYSRETHTEMVYGFQEGVNYKVNFNGNDYLNKFNDFTPYPDTNYIYGYNGDETLDYNCSIYPQNGMYFGTLRFVINGNYYWFIVDPTNDEKLGTWRKGNGYGNEEYTDEELANVTFVLDESVVSQDYIEYLKEVVLDLNGEPVEELVNGQTYKINFNVKDYLDIFDWYADNGKNDIFDWYLYGTNTVGVDSICFYSSGYLNGLYISLNGYYYYMCPHIGKYFPCRWYRSSDIRNSNAYSYQDLQNVNLTMIRKAIVNEELLRAITTNIDGTPIAEDHEETIVETISMDQKMNEPLANKLYQVIEEKSTIIAPLEEGEYYKFKLKMDFSDNSLLMQEFDNLDNGDYIYNFEDSENETYISIQVYKETGWSNIVKRLIYTYDDSDYACTYTYYIYASGGKGESNSDPYINIWDVSFAEAIPYLPFYAGSVENLTILTGMLQLQNEAITKEVPQTLNDKIKDVANWDFGDEKILDVPKWSKFKEAFWDSSYICIYEDDSISIDITNYNNIFRVNIDYTNIPDRYQYWISDTPYNQQGITFEANTWYCADYYSANVPSKVDTPDFILDYDCVIEGYLDLFKAVYGSPSINDKLNEPLKDKVYEYKTQTVTKKIDYNNGGEYTFNTVLDYQFKSYLDQTNMNTPIILYDDYKVRMSYVYQYGSNYLTIDVLDDEGEIDYNLAEYDFSSEEWYYPFDNENDSPLVMNFIPSYARPLYLQNQDSEFKANYYYSYDNETNEYSLLEEEPEGWSEYYTDYWYMSDLDYYTKYLFNLTATETTSVTLAEAPIDERIYELKDAEIKPLYCPTNGFELIFKNNSFYNSSYYTPIYEDENMIVSVRGYEHRTSSAYKMDQYVKFDFIKENKVYMGDNYSEYSPVTWQLRDESGQWIADISSQEELPVITYNENNIISVDGYAELFKALILEEEPKVTLKEKIEDIANWNYKKYNKDVYNLLAVPDWENLLGITDYDTWSYKLYHKDYDNQIWISRYEYQTSEYYCNVHVTYFDSTQNTVHYYDIFDTDLDDYQDMGPVIANTWYEVLGGRSPYLSPCGTPNVPLFDKYLVLSEDPSVSAYSPASFVPTIFSYIAKKAEPFTLQKKFEDLYYSFEKTIKTTDWHAQVILDGIEGGLSAVQAEEIIGEAYIKPYKYCAIILDDNLKNAVSADVLFSIEDSLSGNFAPYLELAPEVGAIAIYAIDCPQTNITVTINRVKTATDFTEVVESNTDNNDIIDNPGQIAYADGVI